MIDFSKIGKINVKKGDVIFFEGSECKSLNLLLSGSVEALNSAKEIDRNIYDAEMFNQTAYRIAGISKNNLLGIEGIFGNKIYKMTRRALEDSIIYIIPISSESDVLKILAGRPDFCGILGISFFESMQITHDRIVEIQQLSHQMNQKLKNIAAIYLSLMEKYKITQPKDTDFYNKFYKYSKELTDSGVNIPAEIDKDFINRKFFEDDDSDGLFDFSLDGVKVEFINAIQNMKTLEKRKVFSESPLLTYFLCKDNAVPLNNLLTALKETLDKLHEIFHNLYCETDHSLFTDLAGMIIDNTKGIDSSFPNLCKYMFEMVKEYYELINRKYGAELAIDRSKLSNMIRSVALVKSNGDRSEATPVSNEPKAILPEELKDSLNQILDYAMIDDETRKKTVDLVEAFGKIEDKSNCDPLIRKPMSEIFFKIYEKVLSKMLSGANSEKKTLLQLFINFGFMDENLLSTSDIVQLCQFNNYINSRNRSTKFPMYYPSEWLKAIYDREKTPGLNEFGEEYKAVFRELKKRGEITDAEKDDFFNNPDRLLKHEVSNMFKTVHKLCYGQLSTYFPVLHGDMVKKELKDAFVSYEKMEKVIDGLLAIDFSAFHRETVFEDATRGISREAVMTPVAPDVILMPTFGSKSMLWQEISGIKKDTPGRIILPCFTAEGLDSLYVKAVGAFRWELCKTIMGVAWNDFSQQALTCEFLDYIQFYKKNRDLSEDARDKVSVLIKKFRNNMRDLFVYYYGLWVTYESQGVMRLDRVARSVLFRNCPFHKEIRDRVEAQPMFADLANRFKNIRKKKAVEVTNRYYRYTKNGEELPKQLADNLAFYKDM